MRVPGKLRLVRSPEPTDDALMLLCAQGHTQGFEALVRRHQDLVIGFATRFFADRQLGREIAQDTFLTVWSDRARYKPQGRFKSYLMTIALNRCRVIAKQKRSHAQKLERLKTLPAPSSETPIDALIDQAQRAQLQAHLATLPPPQRSALILRYLGELSLQEIADVTQKPQGTVKSHIFRGLKQLRKSITGARS